MSTWDDKPNDYEHAVAIIEGLRAENVALGDRWNDISYELINAKIEVKRLRAALEEKVRELELKIAQLQMV